MQHLSCLESGLPSVLLHQRCNAQLLTLLFHRRQWCNKHLLANPLFRTTAMMVMQHVSCHRKPSSKVCCITDAMLTSAHSLTLLFHRPRWQWCNISPASKVGTLPFCCINDATYWKLKVMYCYFRLLQRSLYMYLLFIYRVLELSTILSITNRE